LLHAVDGGFRDARLPRHLIVISDGVDSDDANRKSNMERLSEKLKSRPEIVLHWFDLSAQSADEIAAQLKQPRNRFLTPEIRNGVVFIGNSFNDFRQRLRRFMGLFDVEVRGIDDSARGIVAMPTGWTMKNGRYRVEIKPEGPAPTGIEVLGG